MVPSFEHARTAHRIKRVLCRNQRSSSGLPWWQQPRPARKRQSGHLRNKKSLSLPSGSWKSSNMESGMNGAMRLRSGIHSWCSIRSSRGRTRRCMSFCTQQGMTFTLAWPARPRSATTTSTMRRQAFLRCISIAAPTKVTGGGAATNIKTRRSAQRTNNHENILKVNDLINSFDWLSVKKNEAYPVFTNASTNDPLPWPDRLDDKKSGQVNAFFRWKNVRDTPDAIEMAIFLIKPSELKTTFTIPTEATADISLRRLQKLRITPGAKVHWTFGSANGEAQADTSGCVTIPERKITAEPATLIVKHAKSH